VTAGVGAAPPPGTGVVSVEGHRRKASVISASVRPFFMRKARLEASVEPWTLGWVRNATAFWTWSSLSGSDDTAIGMDSPPAIVAWMPRSQGFRGLAGAGEAAASSAATAGRVAAVGGASEPEGGPPPP